MRIIVALPLLLAACGVESDARNDQLTINYNGESIENAADEVSNAAEQAASDVGNAADRAGQAIENEVGDIDVDLNVSRDRPGNTI